MTQRHRSAADEQFDHAESARRRSWLPRTDRREAGVGPPRVDRRRQLERRRPRSRWHRASEASTGEIRQRRTNTADSAFERATPDRRRASRRKARRLPASAIRRRRLQRPHRSRPCRPRHRRTPSPRSASSLSCAATSARPRRPPAAPVRAQDKELSETCQRCDQNAGRHQRFEQRESTSWDAVRTCLAPLQRRCLGVDQSGSREFWRVCAVRPIGTRA